MKRTSFYYLGYITCIIAVTLTLLGIISSHRAPTVDPSADFQTIYVLVGTVTEINPTNHRIAVQDSDGEVWAFTSNSHWKTNDICIMFLNDNGTSSIYDDAVISVVH